MTLPGMRTASPGILGVVATIGPGVGTGITVAFLVSTNGIQIVKGSTVTLGGRHGHGTPGPRARSAPSRRGITTALHPLNNSPGHQCCLSLMKAATTAPIRP